MRIADAKSPFEAVIAGNGHDAVTRHAARKLDASLYEHFGVHRSDQANAVIANDAATVTCS